MTKLGDEYQELVGAVVQALDPGANVRVGVWVIGPDGRRDLDVEVRGSIDGTERFVLVECKDWRTPVGIDVVDALDSKRRDLGANEAVIYSNSGFTQPALRKADRIGIGMASALRVGDHLVRCQIQKELVAKSLSIDRLSATLYPIPREGSALPIQWQLGFLTFAEVPVLNWIALLTKRLLIEHEPNGQWEFGCTFKYSALWRYEGTLIDVGAIRLHMDCRRSWVSQIVCEDVTLGLYDHLRRRVTIPNRQGYILGPIDQKAWKPYDHEPEDEVIEPNSFSLQFTLTNPIRPASDEPPPEIEPLILEREFKCATP